MPIWNVPEAKASGARADLLINMFCSSSSATFDASWFEKAWREDCFETWFQPIVDTNIASGTADQQRAFGVFGHNCLIRLMDGRLYGDAEIFDEARGRDEAGFEAYAQHLAIRSAASQGKDGLYFIRFMPDRGWDSPVKAVLNALDEFGMSPGNVVFQAFESDLLLDVPNARQMRDFIGRHGFGYCLDDAGKCADSLQVVGDLHPDFITLNRGVVQDVEHPRCAATIRTLAELADRCGAVVIANGVARTRTMENLWLLGIEHMQGYLFGSPAPEILIPSVCRERVVSISG